MTGTTRGILTGILTGALALSVAVADNAVDAPVAATGISVLHGNADADEAAGVRRTPQQAALELGGAAVLDGEYDGTGIDVAVIDSGVAVGSGLAPGRDVVEGVDVSLDDGTARDGYGHGTVMASIIAGEHPLAPGLAPGARIIDVKVANDTGTVDVTQVLAAIDWVVSNRNTDGRNIRVLHLAFGTDGTNGVDTSPLAYAVEAAWRHGIVVVVSAGNHGTEAARLTTPAIDPYIIAVGAFDLGDEAGAHDDSIPEWSAAGDGVRDPDLVAPGRSILGIRARRSTLDVEHPEARQGPLMSGSGTSHATAFTAGVIARMLDADPSLTPDEVKALLTSTARPVDGANPHQSGAGVIDLGALFPGGELAAVPADVEQDFGWSDGTGSLDGDRGSFVIMNADGEPLTGENTPVGPFLRDEWLGSTWSGSTWSGSTWSGSTWSGSTWSGSTWSGSTWSASTWSGSTWSGSGWYASTWSGSTWSQESWLASTWSAFAGVRWL